jgi:hypothetical protein
MSNFTSAERDRLSAILLNLQAQLRGHLGVGSILFSFVALAAPLLVVVGLMPSMITFGGNGGCRRTRGRHSHPALVLRGIYGCHQICGTPSRFLRLTCA